MNTRVSIARPQLGSALPLEPATLPQTVKCRDSAEFASDVAWLKRTNVDSTQVVSDTHVTH